MQHPVGMAFNPDTVRNEMNDFAAVALSPTAAVKFLHTVSRGWLTGAVFVIGVRCWFLIKQRNRNMALRSIKAASLTGIVAGLIAPGTGDHRGGIMAREQPMKLAAAEGLQQGGQRAPFSIVPGIEVPGALSVLATHSIDGYVPGINDLLNGYKRPDGTSEPSADEKMQRGQKAINAFAAYRQLRADNPQAAKLALDTLRAHQQYMGYGYLKDKSELVPPTPIIYWAFRMMGGCGTLLFAILLVAGWLA